MGTIRTKHALAFTATALALWLGACLAAWADDAAPATPPEDWSLHGQATFTEQYHPAFASPYRGANSLDRGSRGDETFDATLFAGLRLWEGGEAYINPEIDQGFGLSDTLGVAGFPSGEAYKVGEAVPYARLQRLFFRQSFDLGGDVENVAPAANQLAGTKTADNVVITAGKFAVVDIFDTNDYAHDPRGDFLNWALIDSGAFDYAADSWAYTYGAAVEWTQGWWTWRNGLFDLSRVPNERELVRGFGEYEVVSEFEARTSLMDRPGKIKLLAYANRGSMGDYKGAVALAEGTGALPDTALVRLPAFKPGAALNAQQEISDALGAFVRLSVNDGSKEAYEFTEINRSLAAGLALKGASWGRKDDTVGAAFVISGMSKSAQSYFADGGLGILIGDGRLPHYGTEDVFETYYRAPVTDWLSADFDYQFIANPAYNRDRGPVSVVGAQLHAQF
ncbi:MAG TPA: carbohydrate porin [Rhizomicrobium sp.]|nr:carbohydrate porin [Rhizomicrobium sp.]